LRGALLVVDTVELRHHIPGGVVHGGGVELGLGAEIVVDELLADTGLEGDHLQLGPRQPRPAKFVAGGEQDALHPVLATFLLFRFVRHGDSMYMPGCRPRGHCTCCPALGNSRAPPWRSAHRAPRQARKRRTTGTMEGAAIDPPKGARKSVRITPGHAAVA